ncbi:hypothetical protein McpSp1_05630 [Methanocorpusculaceae archaeon Sp1]|uniref:DUF47 domain-containing protein n=1 Tax=Methanorbis furvi TaxID=3028299 RepID=A0AAE4MDN6_9EURY|nr:hypothetical protein [Methanocorpusculaceae archaeon Sp1]MDV0442155.1 hypothetical protein [Methanocorpusculaceae archaeon Ag1]
MGLKSWVVPQDKIFFELFEEQAEIVCEAADHLQTIFTDYTDIPEKYRQMKDLEHRGDAMAHRVYEELNRTFITPIEPEEISRLATALDDVIDFIDSGTNMLLIYEIEQPDEFMVEFASVIRQAAEEIRTGVAGLRTLNDPETITGCCIEINRLENQADDILSKALQNLFKTKDPVRIIKLKDIYEHFEIATDKCEDVADVFASILIRHT